MTEDETATLASRLAKLELQLTPAEREELDGIAGEPLKDVVRRLVAAVDPDEQAQAIEAAAGEDPDAVRQWSASRRGGTTFVLDIAIAGSSSRS